MVMPILQRVSGGWERQSHLSGVTVSKKQRGELNPGLPDSRAQCFTPRPGSPGQALGIHSPAGSCSCPPPPCLQLPASFGAHSQVRLSKEPWGAQLHLNCSAIRENASPGPLRQRGLSPAPTHSPK